MWVTTSKAFHYESREKKEHNISKSLRDVKHPPDLHSLYRLHLKSLLVVIFHVIIMISSHRKLAMNIITIVQAS